MMARVLPFIIIETEDGEPHTAGGHFYFYSSLYICLMTISLHYCKLEALKQTSLAEADHYSYMNLYFAKEVMNAEPLR